MGRLPVVVAFVLLVLALLGLRRAVWGSPDWPLGLAATVLLVLAVTILARRALHRRGPLDEAGDTARQDEAESHAIVESSPDGLALLSDDTLTHTNRALRRILALPPEEPDIGRRFLDLVAPRDRDRVAAWLEQRRAGAAEPDRLEFTGVRQGGAEIPLEVAAATVPTPRGRRLALYVRDVSARRTMQDRLQHAARLEALASLAGTVTREFDGVFRQIRRLARNPEQAVPVGEVRGLAPIEAIERLASRGAALARRVRSVAPEVGDAATLFPVDILRLVREVAADFLRALPPGVSLRVSAEGLERVTVLGNSATLRQAVWQVLDNAREAHRGSGEIHVRTRLLVLDDASSSLRPGSRPGTYAVIEVRDEGSGMDESVRVRAFEPFFTTKGSRHSGLGLAIVYGTARAHGGFVELDSFPGRGTLARLALPRHEESQPVGAPAGPEPEAAVRGEETVLVVQEETTTREALRHALEPFGYHVEVASGGREAFARLRRRPTVDLVLLACEGDAASAGPLELLARILRNWPTQRILAVVPLEDAARADAARRTGAVGVLALETTHGEAIARTVRGALDGPPP